MKLRSLKVVTLAVPFVFFMFGGCGSDTDVGTGSVSGSVGSEGGTVGGTNDTPLVEIPAGALSGDTEISVLERAAPDDFAAQVSGRYWFFGPSGTQFSLPVTVHLPFAPTDSDKDLAFFWSEGDGDDLRFRRVQDATISDGHLVGDVTHFSNGYVGVAEPTDDCSARFTLSADGTLTDKTTGNVWYDATGQMTMFGDWPTANQICEDLTKASHDDWRLPTATEILAFESNCPWSQREDACCVPKGFTDGCYVLSNSWWTSTKGSQNGYHKVALWAMCPWEILELSDSSPKPRVVCVRGDENAPSCPDTKDCAGRKCGPDPICGESCGTCDNNESCNNGQCVQGGPDCPADKDCSGLDCGPDPVCGESCGTCGGGESCQAGQCMEGGPDCPADKDCSGLECGPDPVCGESCGTCNGGESCQAGQCTGGSCWPDCGDDVLIPTGSFMMGCNEAVDDECRSNEYPYHEVYLDAYYIERTEVTQAAYKECVDAGACATPPSSCGTWDPSGTPAHPFICVTWFEAMAYCEWVGKRLPTEAEWEKAARGTDGRKYTWGNETATCDYAVMDEDGSGCGTGETWDVCSKSPAGDSPYGLCDMAGNALEWTADLYDSDYYDTSPYNNPTGPNSSSTRVPSWVIRGGTYYGLAHSLRVSSRDAGYGTGPTGFRCAKSE